MQEAGIWFKFAIAVIATWRVTHLLAKEDGPASIIFRIRRRLGNGLLGQLMDCFKCLSLWVAAPMAYLVFRHPGEGMAGVAGVDGVTGIMGWLAISGAACLLDQIGQPPLTIHPLTHLPEGGMDDGMLWSETTVAQKQPGAADSVTHGATERE